MGENVTQPGQDRAALEARNAAMREQVDGLLDKFHQQTAQLQQAQVAAEQVSATITSDDGLVTATVDSAGSLVSMAFAASSFQRSDPKRLASTATETVRRATAEVQRQKTELMAPITEGLPDLADIVEGAPSLQGLMPKVPGEESAQQQAPAREAGPDTTRPETAPPNPRPRARRSPDDDDDDGMQQSWLLPGGR
ncbi:YbaB/EbfC family nucleoid-associated protein [Saccharopolyspora sp. SCSIO 74807]|uniref:YbaB/EbfC family nucleoid-associated protein n=1 Tax=Saccharopolyspora sp. SCSIO 74807 TaxID=3118084 RepID=UPI0030CC7ECB